MKTYQQAEKYKQTARAIVFAARDAEWQRLNREADYHAEEGRYGEAEEILLEMSIRFNNNVTASLNALPACDWEGVGCAVTEFCMDLVHAASAS